MDYIVTSYLPGEFSHVSFDFIMKKGVGIDKNKEIAQTNYETVYRDFDVIINTRSAALNMTIFGYPVCKDGSSLVQSPVTDSAEHGLHLSQKENDEKAINLQPGYVYIL